MNSRILVVQEYGGLGEGWTEAKVYYLVSPVINQHTLDKEYYPRYCESNSKRREIKLPLMSWIEWLLEAGLIAEIPEENIVTTEGY